MKQKRQKMCWPCKTTLWWTRRCVACIHTCPSALPFLCTCSKIHSRRSNQRVHSLHSPTSSLSPWARLGYTTHHSDIACTVNHHVLLLAGASTQAGMRALHGHCSPYTKISCRCVHVLLCAAWLATWLLEQ